MPEQTIHTASNESSLPIDLAQPPEEHPAQAEQSLLRKKHIPSKPCDYSSEPDGLYMPKLDRASNNWVKVKLTNFTATIAKQSMLDDGQDVRREYEIQANLFAMKRSCLVPASQFASMNWVSEHLGAEAVIMPGNGLKDHARAAIQLLSDKIPESRVFTHTGWREIKGVWIYLHGAGAIGPDGVEKDLNVILPEKLSRYLLPVPPADPRAAIRASLDIRNVAPFRITIPLLSATYRAAMRDSDFTVHYAGPTGGGKSEIAALGQQHYGAGMDAKNLPGSWMSTANANEALAFYAKDALFVVDDFVPTGSRQERSRKNADADRLVRGQGNSAGRDRMRADGTLAGTKKPRGLLLSTGEAAPNGESLRGRMFIVDVEKGESGTDGDVNWDCLTGCQKQAREGMYAKSMAGFVQWLAGRYVAMQRDWRQQFEEYRKQAKTELAGLDAHSRLPEAIANLAMGWRYFLDYAVDSNAMEQQESEEWWVTGWVALIEAAKAQAHYRTNENPAVRFINLLQSAIVAGKAHLADEKGNAPQNETSWGWREGEQTWRPQGDRVGWVKGKHVYLNPNNAMLVVQRFANETGESIPLTAETLPKQLKTKGLLASTDKGRGTLCIRRTLEGKNREVLHIKWDDEDCQVDCQANVSGT